METYWKNFLSSLRTQQSLCVVNRNYTVVMLQAMLNFFFYLLIRALAQQMIAVSEFNHCLSLALLNRVKGTFRNAGIK